MRRLRHLLGGERGIALPLALGILTALSATATTVLYFSQANSKHSTYDRSAQIAGALAEAGINNAMAVLSNPSNNALKQITMPTCTAGVDAASRASWSKVSYDGGTAYWCGTLALATSTWSITAVGVVPKPGTSGEVLRKIGASVPIQPVVTQNNNNPAWNYVMATNTGAECDMTVNENITFESALFVHGSLCLDNNANIRVGPVIVKGTVKLDQNGSVGTSAAPIQVAVGGLNRDADGALEYCIQGTTGWSNATAEACDGTDRIYAAPSVSLIPPTIAKPDAPFETWYEDAMPGPRVPCTSANGASSGTVPTFDTNYPTMDTSVATAFNLTPAASYTCRVGPADNAIGELSWNATTRVLTIRGVIFIDGSAYVSNGYLNQYSGQGTLYLRGTFKLDNGSKLCGGVSGSNCDYGDWDPNMELFTIIAYGNGGQVATGDSILIDNNSQFQGALYAQHGITLDNNAQTDGPILGGTVTVNQNYTADDFGTITTVPPGMPGNPEVYAQPNPPKNFSG